MPSLTDSILVGNVDRLRLVVRLADPEMLRLLPVVLVAPLHGHEVRVGLLAEHGAEGEDGLVAVGQGAVQAVVAVPREQHLCQLLLHVNL